MAGLLAAGIALAPSQAFAEDGDRGAFPQLGPRERRSGLVLGMFTGPGLMHASGYPNNVNLIDNSKYYAASGLAFGSGTSLLVMGALSDYLNFGVWFGGGGYENDDWKISGGGGGIRLEVFPLYSVVPKLRDLGVLAQFGIGSSEMKAKHGASPGGDGTQSFLGAGVFYEFRLFDMLGGHFTLAPAIEYQVIDSRPFQQHGAVGGVRIAFYGGP